MQLLTEMLAGKDEWFTSKRFCWILLGLIFAAFPEVVLGSHTFYYRDYGCFSFPVAAYHRESFWRGEIPLWNPYSNSGIPFAAQWNTIVFYPLSLFYLLVPMPWAVGYFCLGHLVLAGMGMYFLAHRWTGSRFAASLAGLVFALNGLMIHGLMWTSNLAALAWMPFVILLVERAWTEGGRTVLLAALAGTTQMLSGAPEFILFTWAILMALAFGESAFSRSIRTTSETMNRAPSPLGGERGRPTPGTLWKIWSRLGLIILLITGLAAIQLLPFIDLLRHSQRDNTFGDNGWALPGWGWANFLVPLFHTSPSITGVFTQMEQQWTSSYYVGIVPLVLAGLSVCRRSSWRTRLLVVVALGGLLLAMGDTGWLLPIARAIIPPLGYMRYPVKFIALAVFAIPLLAASAWPWLANARAEERPTNFRASLRWALAAIITIAALVFWARWAPALAEKWKFTLLNGLVRVGMLVAGLWLVYFATRSAGARWLGAARLGLLLVVAGDLLTHVPRQHPTVITQAFEPGAARLFQAAPKLGAARVMITRPMHNLLEQTANRDALNYCLGCRRAAFANWNLVDAVPKVNGFYSLHPREADEISSVLYHSDEHLPGPLADFLGVTKISNMKEMFSWKDRATAMPLVTIGQRPVFAGPAATLKAIGAATFEPNKVVYLPPEVENLAVVTNGSSGKITAQQFLPQEVRVSVDAGQPAWVVVAQSYYHHWQAWLDGRRVPLWRANHAFQALETPAGRHEIRLVYVDPCFRLGWIVSLVAFAVGVAAWFWLGRRDS